MDISKQNNLNHQRPVKSDTETGRRDETVPTIPLSETPLFGGSICPISEFSSWIKPNCFCWWNILPPSTYRTISKFQFRDNKSYL